MKKKPGFRVKHCPECNESYQVSGIISKKTKKEILDKYAKWFPTYDLERVVCPICKGEGNKYTIIYASGDKAKKRCAICEEVKSLKEYYKHFEALDGYRNTCIICYKRRERLRHKFHSLK